LRFVIPWDFRLDVIQGGFYIEFTAKVLADQVIRKVLIDFLQVKNINNVLLGNCYSTLFYLCSVLRSSNNIRTAELSRTLWGRALSCFKLSTSLESFDL
jgi:hypothetical protein